MIFSVEVMFLCNDALLNIGINILDSPLIPQPLLPQEKGRNIRFIVPLSCGRGARGEGLAL
jgi:hypothetical protein